MGLIPCLLEAVVKLLDSEIRRRLKMLIYNYKLRYFASLVVCYLLRQPPWSVGLIAPFKLAIPRVTN